MRNTLISLVVLLFALIGSRQSLGAPAAQFKTIYQFGALNNIPGSELTIGPAGQLFGTTYGGAYSDGAGSVYELTPQAGGTFAFKELYRFDSIYSPPDDGQNPYAGLTLSPDETTLYGTTQYGGSNNLGTTFSLQISQAEGNSVIKPNYGIDYSYDTVFADTAATGNGSRTTGSAFGDFLTGALFLFGTVVNGGSGDYGALTMLEIHPGSNAVIGVVIPFSPTVGTHPQGKLALGSSAASGSFVPHASGFNPADYTIYGIARSGGSNNWGTVYSVRGDGSNFLTLHHFKFAPNDGVMPLGGMVLSGNTLYGTTSGGGTNSSAPSFKSTPTETGSNSSPVSPMRQPATVPRVI